MGAIAVGVASPGERDAGRPGYGLVLGCVLLAQALGTACIWLATSVLGWLSLVRVNMSGLSIYSPWIVDGLWSAAASVGWATLVVAVVGSFVRTSVQARTGGTLSRSLTLLAVAIGGYAPLAVNANSVARIAAAALLTPALVLALVFDGAGRPRRSGAELSPRWLSAVALAAAVILVAPFAVLHPLLSFANLETPALGSNPNPDTTTPAGSNLHAGEHIQVLTAMKPGEASITVTGVRLVGTGGAVRVDGIDTALNTTPGPTVPPQPLPLRVAAWQALWIRARLTLTHCGGPAVRLTAVRVSYREFGLSLSQTVPLDHRTPVLACPR